MLEFSGAPSILVSPPSLPSLHGQDREAGPLGCRAHGTRPRYVFRLRRAISLPVFRAPSPRVARIFAGQALTAARHRAARRTTCPERLGDAIRACTSKHRPAADRAE